jgi:hypothetical protein
MGFRTDHCGHRLYRSDRHHALCIVFNHSRCTDHAQQRVSAHTGVSVLSITHVALTTCNNVSAHTGVSVFNHSRCTDHTHTNVCRTRRGEPVADERLVSESGKMMVLDRLLARLKTGGHQVRRFVCLVCLTR